MATSADNQLRFVLGLSVGLPVGDGIGLRLSGPTTPTEITETIFFDTARRDLATRGFSLLCQPNGSQAGWRLRQRGTSNQALLAAPLNVDAAIPQDILHRTFGLRAGLDVVEVGRVHAEQSRHELVDDQARVVCGVLDSVFTSTRAEQSSLSAQQWRTLGLEPTDRADPALLERIGRRLRKVGAKQADPQTEFEPDVDVVEAARGDVVNDYVKAQRAAIVVGDVRLRQHDVNTAGTNPGSTEEADIHQVRVALRRLRSTLRNFRKAFDPALSGSLEAELAWYGGVLGQVRDQQVLLERLLGALADVPPDLVLGPVSATISEHLLTTAQQHRHAMREVLCSARYLALLDDVDALVRAGPQAKPLSARDVRTGLAKAEGRLSRRLAEARSQAGTPTADVAWHVARKAAKRARYAAELAAPVLRQKDAKTTVKKLQRLQDSLGNMQDSVVAADLLRRLGAAASQAGQNGFTFGLLYERQTAALRAGRAEFDN